MSVALLREMFDRMVVGKKADLVEHYYDPDFVMYSDGLTQDFAEFHHSHREIYSTPISYAIEYDEQAWVEAADKVAGRVWITTSRPGEQPTRIEVVLIAAFRNGRIHRVWETTWPSWRGVAALENYRPSTRSTQALHQLCGGVAPAEHGAVRRRGIVGAHGLTGQVKPVADGFLQAATVVQTGAGCVERVRAARKGVGGPTRRPDFEQGDVVAEQLTGDGQRAGHQVWGRRRFHGPAAFTGVESRHDRPGGGRQAEPLRPQARLGPDELVEGVVRVPGSAVEAKKALGQHAESQGAHGAGVCVGKGRVKADRTGFQNS